MIEDSAQVSRTCMNCKWSPRDWTEDRGTNEICGKCRWNIYGHRTPPLPYWARIAGERIIVRTVFCPEGSVDCATWEVRDE